MRVTVYSKPNCPQCTATKRWLDKRDVEYIEESLLDHPELVEDAKGSSITSAPVVVLEHGDNKIMWGGFSPSHLKGFLE